MQEINGTSSADWQAKVKSEPIGEKCTDLFGAEGKPVLLIDGDIMLHKLHYGKKGGLLLSDINTWIRKHFTVFEPQDCQVIICLSAKPYKKNHLYPAYKGNRKASKESYKQFMIDFCERVADGDYAPYKVVFATGYEADDLVYTFARDCDYVGWQCYLITLDKDALLCPCPIYWDGIRTELTPAERRAVAAKQAMCGDTGDNIPGFMTERTYDKVFAESTYTGIMEAARLLNKVTNIPTERLITPWVVLYSEIQQLVVEVTDGEDGF